MKKFLFFIGVMAALSGCGGAVFTVKITDTEFIPNRLTLKKGDTIEFINASSAPRWPASNIHPTHDIYPEFDPQQEVAPGASWKFTFDQEGVWRFHDHVAPELKGVIEVQE